MGGMQKTSPSRAGAEADVAWTVGHSTRTTDALIELLRAHEIALLVDVRTVPRSRHNPQFNKDELPTVLAAAGIEYRHGPELGGLRKPDKQSINTGWRNAGFRGYADYMQAGAFRAAVDALADEARRRRLSVMCAEAVPWRCHRSLIADALLVRGFDVRHIMGTGPAQSHKLTAFARVEDERITYPGLL